MPLQAWGIASIAVFVPFAAAAVLGLAYVKLAGSSNMPSVELMAIDAKPTVLPVQQQEAVRPTPEAVADQPVVAVSPPQQPVKQTVAAAIKTPVVQSSAPVAPVTQVAAIRKLTGPTFDGRPLRKARQMTMLVTAYSPDERSCGIWADGVTASGYSVWTNGMKLVAADTRILPFGTVISVPGYNGGKPVQVLDRGGKIKGHRLDVLYPTHEIARKWGSQRLTVTIWEYAD